MMDISSRDKFRVICLGHVSSFYNGKPQQSKYWKYCSSQYLQTDIKLNLLSCLAQAGKLEGCEDKNSLQATENVSLSS